MKTNPSVKIFKFSTLVPLGIAIAPTLLTQPISPMKTDTNSNSGPLSRAFAPLLFAAVAAALCLIPVTGRAVIVVTNANNTIGEYNATTGATINSSFISSGLDFPDGIVLSGGNLFVTNAL